MYFLIHALNTHTSCQNSKKKKKKHSESANPHNAYLENNLTKREAV